jgi:hypothetical protein
MRRSQADSKQFNSTLLAYIASGFRNDDVDPEQAA